MMRSAQDALKWWHQRYGKFEALWRHYRRIKPLEPKPILRWIRKQETKALKQRAAATHEELRIAMWRSAIGRSFPEIAHRTQHRVLR